MKSLLPIACFAALCSAQQTAPVNPSARGTWNVTARSMSQDGHLYHLIGHAEIRGQEILLRADSIDFDEDKATMHLTGHVTIQTPDKGILNADEAEFDANSGDLHLKIKLSPR